MLVWCKSSWVLSLMELIGEDRERSWGFNWISLFFPFSYLIFLWPDSCHPDPHAHIFSLQKTHIRGRILTLHPSQHALTPPASVCCRLLYLIGLQFVRIAGQPLHQVAGDHVARATGKRRVGWTGVLQLLPLSNAIHCPALPETGSGQQGHHHHHTLSVCRQAWPIIVLTEHSGCFQMNLPAPQSGRWQQLRAKHMSWTYFPHQKLLRRSPFWSIFINTESTSM